jgi:F-type H+-transporting ATPase subunit b
VLIDWFTVVAQIVNFLVLVALLKHFLWGRLMRAIDEREARIAGELAGAEQKTKEAERHAEEVRAREAKQEQKRGEMMVQARKEADDERAKMIQKARNDANDLEKKWREDMDREQTAFLAELKTRAASETLAVMRRALADLSSVDLQQAVVAVFLDKLRSLDVETLRELGSNGQLVRSALDLPEPARQNIEKILGERLGVPLRLTFEKDPAMAWGIELRGNGRKISWTPESYLDSLEENLKAALARQEKNVERQVTR